MNYYELLEIREDASPEVIEMAYKALLRKYHPDVYRGDSDFAHDITQRINEAHEALANSESRTKYDAALAAERAAHTDGEEKGDQKRRISLPRKFSAGILILLILCLILAVVSGILALRASTLTAENKLANSRLTSIKSTLSAMESNNVTLQQEKAKLRSDLRFYYSRACVIADYSKRYHHLGCSYLNPEHAYILDVENADRLGYSPCPHCWEEDFDDFYKAVTSEEPE